jgi:hypothetical protein
MASKKHADEFDEIHGNLEAACDAVLGDLTYARAKMKSTDVQISGDELFDVAEQLWSLAGEIEEEE